MKLIGTVLRIVVAATWILTSLYSLLAYVPFTYRQVISIELVPAVQFFARAQPALLAVSTLLLIIFVLRFEKRETITLEDRRELLVVGGAAFCIAIWNLPKRIDNDGSALIWSFACLLPPLWLAFFTIRDVFERRAFALSSACIVLSATLAGLGVVTTTAWVYNSFSFEAALTTVAVAVIAGCGAALIDRFIDRARLSLQNALILYASGLSVLSGIFLADQFCASIAFSGPLAWFWSMMFAGVLCLTVVAVGARTSWRDQSIDLPSIRWIARGMILRKTELLSLVGVAIAYGFFQRAVITVDWNGLIQKIAALSFFVVSFFITVLIIPDFGSDRPAIPHRKLRNVIVFGLTVLALVGITALRFSQTRIRSDRGTDPVFLLSKRVLFPDESESGFFKELQSRTNLPRSTITKLPAVELKPLITIDRPHPLIFIFVIDSLRRDYVSAYNSSVSFTPSIGNFAKESTVFKTAFTRYGATGLSEPSIWAGQMFPHQLYPQPFESINLLHRLIKLEKYDVWLSRDSILSEILKPDERDRDLDVGVGTQNLDFCKTADEIVRRLTEDPSQRPFVFSQSQNIHVSVLARNTHSPTQEKVPTGFYRPYAEALERLDICFGKFIDQLKSLQLYDQSLIVLTSDHGDSLGEEGRFGHAYTVYPEVVRIPLIVHLPSSMNPRVPRGDITFSTDIAPTLASLLGYKVQAANWWEGRPLFIGEGDEPVPSAPAGPHLVMSSYGPVAGLISNSGDSMAIADAVNFSNYVYKIHELESSNAPSTTMSETENNRLLKEKIDQLYSAFGL